MKKLVIVLALSLFGMFAVAGAVAPTRAAGMEQCSHESTVQSLRQCVEHAVMEGHIDSGTIARSLFAKLDAAQAALDRGQRGVAVQILLAFTHEVQAQAGQHIEAENAAHMVAHAQEIIAALR